MSEPFDIHEILSEFSGQAALFPLPNLVQFPHTWQPLHIFEPRYRAMIEDALAGDRWLAMALLRPHWEASYDTKFAEVHPTVCLGRIELEQRLPDGRFNLVLHGVCRARIESELATSQPFRTAKLTALPDFFPKERTIDRQHRHRELLSAAAEMLPELQSDPLVHQLLDAELPLGVLCDVLAHSMGLDTDTAQLLLDELDVDLRSDLVLHLMKKRQRHEDFAGHRYFPPAFSMN